jgi:tetratricopeptide (TPR) repeat protein
MNVLLAKGNALNNLSRYFEAIASFDKVLNTYPDQDIALNGKGKALFNLGKYVDAITFFDKVLAMNSSDIYISNEASKNKDAAIEALKKGQKFNSTDGDEPNSINVTTTS